MPLANYGVVKGDFDHFTRDNPDNFGRYFHGHVFVRVPNPVGDGTIVFECACDVNTPSGVIEYFRVSSLDASKFQTVAGLPDGHHYLPTLQDNLAPTGGALDYIRNPLISLPMGCLALWYLLLNGFTHENNQVWVVNTGTEAMDVLQSVVTAPDVVKVFIFGARYDNPEQSPPQGMHDVHYNQGDPPGTGTNNHQPDDGIWQDGGVIVRHQDGRLEGFFVKFGTQSLNTNNNGLPA
jgi:hypothetical protein